MDIKDLNKTQLILLTLLITFVVSIATGIVTVSLMNQMPKRATQTINNVIQRTIEKVTTTTPIEPTDANKKGEVSLSDGEVLVSIFSKDYVMPTSNPTDSAAAVDLIKPLSQGIIISDSGLVLIESNTLNSKEDSYRVMLGKDLYDAKILKSFGNGFVVLQIGKKSNTVIPVDDTKKVDQKPTDNSVKQ